MSRRFCKVGDVVGDEKSNASQNVAISITWRGKVAVLSD
jgi:hypothetical protein